MSTTHEEREAFALLDEAIDATFAIARGPDSDPNDVPFDAVLIVGVQRVDDNGSRIGHVELFPRAGSQPASVRRLIGQAGQLLELAAADNDDRGAGDDQP